MLMTSEKRVLLVMDLDGTLYDGFEYYVRAHMRTLKKLETCGLIIPEELKFFDSQYKTYVECVKCIPFYYSMFLAEYKEEIENNKEEINKKSLAAWKLMRKLEKVFKPKEIYILTANPQAKLLLQFLSIQIPSNRIVVIDGKEYIKKKGSFLKKLKKKGEVVYVGDSEEDEIVAKKLGINFFNVFTLKSNPNQVHSLLEKK